MRREKLPPTVNCINCRRTLELQKYTCEAPDEDTVEAERIHHVAYPRLEGFTVQCTCGHYMRYFSPMEG